MSCTWYLGIIPARDISKLFKIPLAAITRDIIVKYRRSLYYLYYNLTVYAMRDGLPFQDYKILNKALNTSS